MPGSTTRYRKPAGKVKRILRSAAPGWYRMQKAGIRWLLGAVLLQACGTDPRNELYPHVPLEGIAQGAVLAKKHCQSCHMLPNPAQLDAQTWQKGVLPQMGPRLGIFHYGYTTYPADRFDRNISAGYYPDKPVVSEEEWQHIMEYYVATAPARQATAQPRHLPIAANLSLFEAIKPMPVDYPPATSLVQIDTSGKESYLIIADAQQKMVATYNQHLEPVSQMSIPGPWVNLEGAGSERLVCDIGLLHPNTGRQGKAWTTTFSGGHFSRRSSALLTHLARPVQITRCDLNVDGREDYLVCEFGYREGALSWMEHKNDGRYERHVLRGQPGAIKAVVQDVNGDRLPDLWVLFTQGEEGLFLFTNKGGGRFDQQQVLRFSPLNGSSYFELKDFNQDGLLDIVYTCGDNADYSTVLKPFHGVYIFLNEGNQRFKQRYFFPLNGCFKAIAEDYDGDGDLDIAAISFFPDAQQQPQEGFVYLQNAGNFRFLPYSLPVATEGRWLTMDAGDINRDGKIDLLLGNFSVAPAIIKGKKDWKKGPPFLVLLNAGDKGKDVPGRETVQSRVPLQPKNPERATAQAYR